MRSYANQDDAPYTVVELWIGIAQHPRCDADMFTLDTLTITCVDTGDVMAVYKPGDWKTSITQGGGYPLYAFTSETPMHRIIPFDELFPSKVSAA